ncbi:2Fe-2S iron-sulfur cluster-binding protein [Tenacibaculum aquimarinum]|uniref:2Fe-2S iron-sulfur cluster-binding protein n=1 Tax=Tenacibaculum aquimarinum TaxID=2910675 RepID=UPI001F0A92F5|nr:2Fe-2S iron-sulfur cluster-binding protein [Tenacibaculum aquimarinum]MCH3883648.1 2Fe-2S iron-sulfur cluster-binding protein [Tenacibaculum aquimarinum]
MNTFYKLKIKELIQETKDAVSILFSVPSELKETFSFKAGQYITIKKVIKGEEVRRAYSICSSPKSGDLKVAVKAVENGLFSVYATTELKAGDELEVHPPEGKFILEPKANKNYIAFAAGSGITPVLSMIKTVLEEESSSKFTLVYGNKMADSVIFNDELEHLVAAYPNNFKLHTIFSRDKVKNALQGRIDSSVCKYFVKNMYKETSFDSAYLCGPEEMITAVTETLKENNFTSENIHFELFTASSDEGDTSEVKDGETTVTILLDDEETTFTMKQTDDILAASLRNKVDAPYSCQGGVCSSCLGKVTEGKAVMVKNSILTDDEVEDGFILTCQAHPTTPKIVVDFDDV